MMTSPADMPLVGSRNSDNIILPYYFFNYPN
jgi:hypothetical protein